MKIIEEFIQGKINMNLCEDSYVITEDFIAVVDGVSSKTNFLFQNKKTGKLAAEIICSVIKKISLDANISDIVQEVNLAFSDFYDEVDFPYNKSQYGLQAMAVIYSRYYQKIWLIGDCQVLVNGQYHSNIKRSDRVLEELRSLVAHVDMARDKVTPEEYFAVDDHAREVILPWIAKATIFANEESSEWGYSVFNGESIPIKLVDEIAVEENDEIVLATDGYPRLEETFSESEVYLAKAIKEDRYGIKEYKSTKGLTNELSNSFDDRTYIKFQV